MTNALSRIARFEEEWRSVLARAVRVDIACEARACSDLPNTATAADLANASVTARGYQSIGFNWEMLDPHGSEEAPRSALGAMVEALGKDISNPSRQWLDEAIARRCAKHFLAAFDAGSMTLLTNHLHGLWWPISEARDEWTFIAMDDRAIAMLLLARQ